MNWIFSKEFTGTARLDHKTVIVTGCNSGLGKETAREFYKRGARVIMACRDVSKAEEAAYDIRKSTEGLLRAGELVTRRLDLASFDEVRRCATEILNSEPAIHLLVNNAATISCPKEISKDGYELQFQVNYLGHFLFTLLLLPRLIKSRPARIVNVSSWMYIFALGELHLDDVNLDRVGYHRFWAYFRSKLANILFAKELGRRLAGTGVTTYALHPGSTITNLHYTSDLPFRKLILRFAPYIFKTNTQAIQTTLYCSLDEKCGDETGLYYMECAPACALLGRNAERKAKELWEESVKFVKLENVDGFTPTHNNYGDQYVALNINAN